MRRISDTSRSRLTIARARSAVKQNRGDVDEKLVIWWIVSLLAQDPSLQIAQAQAERVRAAMAGSIAAQRESVRKQLESLSMRVSNAPFRKAVCEAITQPELSQMIDVAAKHQSVDPGLVREVARQESGFKPCAVSSKGAEGLMQLMPATQIQLQVQNPFSAQESLEAGSKLLKQLLDRYHGDLAQALSAYNAGPARVDRDGDVPAIPETQNYVSTIMKRLMMQPDSNPPAPAH